MLIISWHATQRHNINNLKKFITDPEIQELGG
jgi:hypothetical protein